MTSSRIDYFRMTIKPERETSNIPDERGLTPYDHAIQTLRVTLLLDELINKMSYKGRCSHYDQRISYENISLKIPTPHDYPEQGMCFELSSQGLDYFFDYLASYGLTFQSWCGMLRALCFQGYVINITRLDFAMDDITSKGETTVISLKRVLKAIADGEMCCKARVWSDMGNDINRLISYKTNIKRVRGEELHGLTLQLGSRNSETICRFYDKRTEQLQKGNELPADCISWTRCEFEFKGSNAMSVLNAYIDYDPKHFSEYMCGVALNFVRFVERTSDNVSRCKNKRWWKEFLNGATKAVKFEHIKPARSAAVKFNRWIRKSVLPSIYSYIQTMGFDAFCEYLETMAREDIQSGRDLCKPDLINNLRDDKRYYEHLNAFKRWEYNSDLTPDELQAQIKRQHFDYFQQFYKVIRLGERPDPQGVLT